MTWQYTAKGAVAETWFVCRGGSGPGQATVSELGGGACVLREGVDEAGGTSPLSPAARAAAAVAANLVRTARLLTAGCHSRPPAT